MPFSNKLKVTGLTGIIGSGKSSVAAFWLAKFNLSFINADLVGRELLAPGRPGWENIRHLCKHFILKDQQIDRIALRRALFHDETLRRQLDQALHPLIRDEIRRQIAILAVSRPDTDVLVEVPLLHEAGWENDFSKIILVYVDSQQGLKRIIARDEISRQEAEKAMQAQWSATDKIRRSDHVINNNLSWPATVLQLSHLGRLLWSEKRLTH